ncbi:MAG: Crp/Fnr family transcriptional regulator [Rhodoblastus sp.]
MSSAEAAARSFCAKGAGLRCGDCNALFAALDEEARAGLMRMCRQFVLAPKDTAFAQGDAASRIFCLAEGVMCIYKLLPDGRRQVTGFALPGDFFELTRQDVHTQTAEAITPASVCACPRSQFRRLMEGNAEALRRMNEIVARELGGAYERMMMLGRYMAEEKMAAFLLSWRESQRLSGHRDEVTPIPMSRRDMADYLGLTIETVSRTFTKLERAGVIEIVSGGVRIVDERRAEQMASGHAADRMKGAPAA